MAEDPFATAALHIVPGGRLLRCRPLKGGVSASVHALEIIGTDGRVRRVVLRRHGTNGKPLETSPIAREFELLSALERLGIAVPEVHFFDDSCEVFPTPYLVMEFIEGSTSVSEAELPGALVQMAVYLARLHAIELDGVELPDLPDLEDPIEGVLKYLPTGPFGEKIRAALTSSDTLSKMVSTASSRRSLLHGDYWPGNILWQAGQLAAVLDWEDASAGDPLSDLACCRVELQCAYGRAAMDAFTDRYLELVNLDLVNLPLWEVYVSSSALATMSSWGLEPEVEAARRRETVGFMERAGRELLLLPDWPDL